MVKSNTLLWTSLVLMTLTLSHTQDREDWIDPNDMLNFDPSTNTMKKNKVPTTINYLSFVFFIYVRLQIWISENYMLFIKTRI